MNSKRPGIVLVARDLATQASLLGDYGSSAIRDNRTVHYGPTQWPTTSPFEVHLLTCNRCVKRAEDAEAYIEAVRTVLSRKPKAAFVRHTGS
jgi:hypothetical protein